MNIAASVSPSEFLSGVLSLNVYGEQIRLADYNE
jgi:hypothetical protein